MSLDHLQALFSGDNKQPIEEHKEHTKEPTDLILTRHIERDKNTQELYFQMADSIKKSEELRIKLTKGIKDHTPTDDLLLIAIECISLMIDDKTYYQLNTNNLKGRP